MSIIDPLTCGFAKVAAYNILSNTYGIVQDNNELVKHKSRLLGAVYMRNGLARLVRSRLSPNFN